MEYFNQKPLTQSQFSDLCLLGLHRLAAENDKVPSSQNDPKVKKFLGDVSKECEISIETTKGLYYVRQYLSRTPAGVGQDAVGRLRLWQKTSGSSLKDLTVEEWASIRHEAENHYMQKHLDNEPYSRKWFRPQIGSGTLLKALQNINGQPAPAVQAASVPAGVKL
jgi:hypothetical protein